MPMNDNDDIDYDGDDDDDNDDDDDDDAMEDDLTEMPLLGSEAKEDFLDAAITGSTCDQRMYHKTGQAMERR